MKKVLSLGLATALAVGALSGCGGGKPAETTAAPAAAQTTAAGRQLRQRQNPLRK